MLHLEYYPFSPFGVRMFDMWQKNIQRLRLKIKGVLILIENQGNSSSSTSKTHPSSSASPMLPIAPCTVPVMNRFVVVHRRKRTLLKNY
jgi:hypothetical protein